jgi:hypothetical protein
VSSPLGIYSILHIYCTVSYLLLSLYLKRNCSSSCDRFIIHGPTIAINNWTAYRNLLPTSSRVLLLLRNVQACLMPRSRYDIAHVITNKLTPCSWAILHTHGHMCNYSLISQNFMKPEGSLPYSPSNCPCPEPEQSSPYRPILSLKLKLRGLSPRANYTDRATAAVGDVSAKFCGYRVPRSQRDGSLRPYSRLSRPQLLLFLSSSSSIVLTRLSGPRSRPTTSQKIW